jgi:hypothetical protein
VTGFEFSNHHTEKQWKKKMESNSKSVRKKLKELSGIAYQRDLDKALETLFTQFKKWNSKEIDCFALNEKIHKYHDGIARDLWKFYRNDPGFIVAKSISDNTLSEKDVPQEIYKVLERQIKAYKNLKENQ